MNFKGQTSFSRFCVYGPWEFMGFLMPVQNIVELEKEIIKLNTRYPNEITFHNEVPSYDFMGKIKLDFGFFGNMLFRARTGKSLENAFGDTAESRRLFEQIDFSKVKRLINDDRDGRTVYRPLKKSEIPGIAKKFLD